MRVLFLNIALRPDSLRKHFPIGLSYVASSAKRAGYDVDILDLETDLQSTDRLSAHLTRRRYDVIAMGCIVTGYHFVIELSSTIKDASPDSTVVVGNTVASSIPDTLLRNTQADIAVLGEGDVTFPDLLNAIEYGRELDTVPGIAYIDGGTLVETPERPLIKDLDSLPHPMWELFDVEFYIKNMSRNANEPLPPIERTRIRAFNINTARGCPYRCTFCYHAFYEQKYRWRSPSSIVEEMRELNCRFGINLFNFHDELTFFSAKQASEFAACLQDANLNVYYAADCRSGLFCREDHIEIARKLKRSGCLSLSYSLESASPPSVPR